MSHIAIYRKYRPTNFDEVCDQKVVVSILKNSIKNDNISHAYLFTGPRGTGKTSIAKIFARTINCEQHINGNPCEKCEKCNDSRTKECVDIIEIDAASNNGVDEIRELKSKINIVPSNLKYKVYIIDEVHMLSVGAFNALLKTLEEPPSHAIFILATTELHKVPITILSRCQVLEFKKISKRDMKEKIKDICVKESINIEEAAIDEIVDMSEGCMRDALSGLEKMTAYCNNNITYDDVRKINGKASETETEKLINLIVEKNIEETIEKINYFYINDYDLLKITEDIINKLEKIIFKQQGEIKCNYNELLSGMIEIYDKMLKSSVDKKIMLEVELLRLMIDSENKNISREIFSEKKSKINVENKENNIDIVDEKYINEQKNKFPQENFKKIRINNAFANANKEMLLTIKKNWEKFNEHAFDKEKGIYVCDLIDAVPVVASEEYLIVSSQLQSTADKINENYKIYEQILKQYLEMNFYISAISLQEWNKYKNEFITQKNNGIIYKKINDEFVDKNDDKENKNEVNEFINVQINVDNKISDLFESNDIVIEEERL